MEALLDNDLLWKLTRYGLLYEFERLLALRGYDAPHKRVASASWSLRTMPGKIRADLWPDPAQADTLRTFCFNRSAGATGSSADALTALNVPAFDAGELQLVAYALDHPSSVVFTGDKRAIQAVCHQPALAAVKAATMGRFVHLNSVMRDISDRVGWTRVALAVMAAPIDYELSAAYAKRTEREMEAAVAASIIDLRSKVPGMLMAGTP